VLYLAEIQKQSKGFMGGVETRLKLIACQRNDQSWSIVGNESIATEEANDFGDGALIVVNLSVNRQIQGKLESASGRVVGVLQGFSRLLEKTKSQEQEIEQWKESLTIQSEELSRRQIEMETRLEQVEQMEEEFKQFEQQREEIATAKAATDNIKAEFEARSIELQGAWDQLRGQEQRLEEQVQQSKVLDQAQAALINEQLQVLSNASDSNDSLQNQLHLAAEAVKTQQEILQPHWPILAQNTQDIQNKRQELDHASSQLAENKQQVELLSVSITKIEQELKVEQQSLEVKQELTKFLNSQLTTKNNMLEMLSGSGVNSDQSGQKIDLKALENMPLPNLETMVESLKKDLEKVAKFVNDQEEELGWQCKAVEELEAKIGQVSEFERLTLEQELADEMEAKKMLDKTLIGQRRSLKERHRVLLQHSRILKRRQGIIDLDFDVQDIDLEPIKQSLHQQQQQLEGQQQELTQEIVQIERKIQELQINLQQQTTKKEELVSEIHQQQDSWQQLNIDVVQVQSKIDFYGQQLQPLQNALDNISHQLSEMEQLMANYAQNNPQIAIATINNIITELTAN
jgi:DNA repair exonuclease SbcCD ATPase subunit